VLLGSVFFGHPLRGCRKPLAAMNHRFAPDDPTFSLLIYSVTCRSQGRKPIATFVQEGAGLGTFHTTFKPVFTFSL